jgi:uncharacterized protein (TIGR02246 family)
VDSLEPTTIAASVDDLVLVRAALAGWVDAVRRADIPAILDHVTDDAVFYPAHGPILEGKLALAAAFEALYARFHAEQFFQEHEAFVQGDLAFVRGEERFVLTPVGGGHPVAVSRRTFTLLRRTGGVWKMARGMNNHGDVTAVPPGR